MYRTVWFWYFIALTKVCMWFAYCMLMNDYLYTRPRQTISQWNANSPIFYEMESEPARGGRERGQGVDRRREEDSKRKRGYGRKRKRNGGRARGSDACRKRDGGSIKGKSAQLIKAKVRNRLISIHFSRLRHMVCDSRRACYLCHSLSVVISLKNLWMLMLVSAIVAHQPDSY